MVAARLPHSNRPAIRLLPHPRRPAICQRQAAAPAMHVGHQLFEEGRLRGAPFGLQEGLHVTAM